MLQHLGVVRLVTGAVRDVRELPLHARREFREPARRGLPVPVLTSHLLGEQSLSVRDDFFLGHNDIPLVCEWGKEQARRRWRTLHNSMGQISKHSQNPYKHRAFATCTAVSLQFIA